MYIYRALEFHHSLLTHSKSFEGCQVQGSVAEGVRLVRVSAGLQEETNDLLSCLVGFRV